MAFRVSTAGQQQVILTGLFQNQARVFEGQRQINTGKISDDYAGLAGNASTILDSRAFQARVETYRSSIDTVRGNLEANDNQLQGMISAMEELQDQIRAAIANNEAQGFSELLDQTFSFVTSTLNTSFNGAFLFAGADTGTRPVNVNTLPDLAALGTVADAFDNSDVGFQARIADDVDIQFGLLADDIATDSLQVMLDLYNFDTGAGGPFDGELTAAQVTELQARLGDIDNAIGTLRTQQANNGLVFGRLEVVDEQHAETRDFLRIFIDELEGVDVAEAITNLDLDRVALQASYQAVASLNQLTLLNFI